MTTRIVTDSNGRKHITNEPLLHPPKRQWVGLTDKEIDALESATDTLEFPQTVKAIEAKLKELNT
jgi:hypothetical protein